MVRHPAQMPQNLIHSLLGLPRNIPFDFTTNFTANHHKTSFCCRRAGDLERETLAQREVENMAERAAQSLQSMDRATDELQNVMAAAYGWMNEGAGRGLLPH
jgi:hypothetical protein